MRFLYTFDIYVHFFVIYVHFWNYIYFLRFRYTFEIYVHFWNLCLFCHFWIFSDFCTICDFCILLELCTILDFCTFMDFYRFSESYTFFDFYPFVICSIIWILINLLILWFRSNFNFWILSILAFYEFYPICNIGPFCQFQFVIHVNVYISLFWSTFKEWNISRLKHL